jgi:hypothetical protein
MAPLLSYVSICERAVSGCFIRSLPLCTLLNDTSQTIVDHISRTAIYRLLQDQRVRTLLDDRVQPIGSFPFDTLLKDRAQQIVDRLSGTVIYTLLLNLPFDRLFFCGKGCSLPSLLRQTKPRQF